MKRLLAGAILVLALAGCSGPPTTAPSPSSTAVDDAQVLGQVRAKLCTSNNPEPWDTCVQEATRYLSLALQIHDEMVAAGTATPDMDQTASDMKTLLARCTPADVTKASTTECQYTFDTIKSTGQTFQQQIVAAK